MPDSPVVIEFGRFRVVPRRRELLADGRPIKLGGRDFDVLTALIEATGAVISKDELMSRVWPGRIVEENTLQGAISALRKAFGADRDLGPLRGEATNSLERSARAPRVLQGNS